MWLLSAVLTPFFLVLSKLVLSVMLVDLHWKGQVLTHVSSLWLCFRTLSLGGLSIYILWFVVVWWGIASWIETLDPFLLGVIQIAGMPVVLFPILDVHIYTLWTRTDEGRARVSRRVPSKARQTRRQRRRIGRALVVAIVLLFVTLTSFKLAENRAFFS